MAKRGIERVPLALLGALLVYAAVRSAYVSSELPEVMASHFDAFGRPNGFMPRALFFGVFIVIGGGTVAMLLAIPRSLKSVPPSRLNLPNRAYWIAPERLPAVYAKLRVWSAWYALITTSLLVVVLELALRANLARAEIATTPMWLAIGAFVLASLASVVGLVRAFRIPERER